MFSKHRLSWVILTGAAPAAGAYLAGGSWLGCTAVAGRLCSLSQNDDAGSPSVSAREWGRFGESPESHPLTLVKKFVAKRNAGGSRPETKA